MLILGTLFIHKELLPVITTIMLQEGLLPVSGGSAHMDNTFHLRSMKRESLLFSSKFDN
jgi:hypothetical protein